jgi:cellobiose phosphorylase
MLGLRLNVDHFILDPVLPNCLDNLQFTYKIDKKCVIILYKKTNEEKLIINGVNVPFTKETKAYRNGGYVISKEHLQENNVIEVHF